jgi:hypothetical protein
VTLDKTFVLLVFCHQLADQPLQTDYIVRAKRGEQPGIPAWLGLAYHAFMHGALVLLVTGSMVLFVAETLTHWSIDAAKIAGCFGSKTDQCLHIGFKVVWVLYLMWIRSVGL